MNIVDPILFQASLQPMNAAICAPGSAMPLISYGRLAMVINTIAHALRKLGVSRGKVFGVRAKSEIFEIAIILALARLGVASVKHTDKPTALKIDGVIADEYPQRLTVGQSVILADESWIEAENELLQSHELPGDCTDDLCRIVLTSGSTGTAKAVGLTHRIVANRVPRHLTICGARFPRYSRIYCDLPPSTSLGFQFLIYTLWRGGTFLVPGQTFAHTVEAMEEYKAECWVASPGGLELLVKWFERTPSLGSEIKMAVCGGDKTSRSLADRVRARVCAHVIAAYGSSEAAMTAAAPLDALADEPDAVGVIAPDAVVQAVDENDEVLPAGAQGRIRVKSFVAVDRYLDDEDASATAFRGGWFYPGDLGSITPTNMLHIVGRQDNLINLGGDKISPEPIERVIVECPGVTECAAFGIRRPGEGEEMWVAVPADLNVSDAELKTFAEQHLPSSYWPAGFVRLPEIPRNAMGKIDRGALPPLWKRQSAQ